MGFYITNIINSTGGKNNLKIFSIAIEPDFNKVLEKLDEQAAKECSSRSALVREILYEHYGIKQPRRIEIRNRRAYSKAT